MYHIRWDIKLLVKPQWEVEVCYKRTGDDLRWGRRDQKHWKCCFHRKKFLFWLKTGHSENVTFVFGYLIEREIVQVPFTFILRKTVHPKIVRTNNSVRPSKKTHVSRPRPLHFLAPPLFFYYFLWATVFMSKNQQASLVKPIAAVYTPK